jgi:hypothetical protein
MQYDIMFVEEKNEVAYFDITIAEQKRRIRFVKQYYGYRSTEKLVYVRISETTDYYAIPNRVRKAYLYIIQNDRIKQPTLCDFYKVSHGSASIVSWIGSEVGKSVSAAEAVDGVEPKPDIDLLDIILNGLGSRPF